MEPIGKCFGLERRQYKLTIVHDDHSLCPPSLRRIDRCPRIPGTLDHPLYRSRIRTDDRGQLPCIDHIAKAYIDQFSQNLFTLLYILNLFTDFFDLRFKIDRFIRNGQITGL